MADFETRGTNDTCHLPSQGHPVVVRVVNRYRNTYSVWIPGQGWWAQSDNRRKAFGTYKRARKALCETRGTLDALKAQGFKPSLQTTNPIKNVTVERQVCENTEPSVTVRPLELPTPLFERRADRDGGFWNTAPVRKIETSLMKHLTMWLDAVHARYPTKNFDKMDLMYVLFDTGNTIILTYEPSEETPVKGGE